MQRNSRHRPWFLFIVMALLLKPWALSAATPRFALVQGVLDLCQWDLDTLETLEVVGEVEFAWERFAIDDGWPETPTYMNYPGAWNLFSHHPAAGFASYRMRVKLPRPLKLGLSFPLPWSASQNFINGQLVHQEGQPGRNAQGTRGGMHGTFLWTWEPRLRTLKSSCMWPIMIYRSSVLCNPSGSAA
ncbi:MAG: hypothetical protein M3Q07_00375 [Pseudobdellovibrionaceae bacterium]|nr:hypothetical protein [Pseudobdellovibrionaceae bacterium]